MRLRLGAVYPSLGLVVLSLVQPARADPPSASAAPTATCRPLEHSSHGVCCPNGSDWSDRARACVIAGAEATDLETRSMRATALAPAPGGSLRVQAVFPNRVVPPSARVRVDDRVVPLTSETQTIPVDASRPLHEVEVRASGFVPSLETVAGANTSVTLEVAAADTVITVHVALQGGTHEPFPRGATVTVNDQSTPLDAPDQALRVRASGETYHLIVNVPGYYTREQSVTLAPGASGSVSFDLEPAPNVDVSLSGLDCHAVSVRFLVGSLGRTLGYCDSHNGGACSLRLPTDVETVTVRARGTLVFDVRDVPVRWNGGHAQIALRATVSRTSAAWLAVPIVLGAAAAGSFAIAAGCGTDTCTDVAWTAAAASTVLLLTLGMHEILSVAQPQIDACAVDDTAHCTHSGHLLASERARGIRVRGLGIAW